MTDHVRVLIIGGGAMGVSALYHLAKAGWRDIALVEKNELTAGSTWHAAGLCTHFAHNITIQALRAHSVRLYSGGLEAETGSPVSFHQTGALRVTRSAERMAEFAHVKGIGKFSGYDFNILSPAELKEIYPLVELDGLLGAIHEPLDGHVDPSQATHAMAQGARHNGAKIHRHTQVTGLAQQPSGEWRVTTSMDEFIAEHIVMAAGTWAYEIGRMAGLELPIVPMLHQYLVTEGVTEIQALERELPIIRDPEESWYLRQERDGFIVGPYEKNGKPWSIDGVPPEFGMELLPGDLDPIENIVAAAMARVPALASAGIKTIVNGPITFTPDANPLIGPAFGLTNCWLLTGSSMGVMEGGGAGWLLAEWLMNGESPMDALAVDPRRFGGHADRDYRIAKAVEAFGNQFAVHYPYEERTAGRPRLMSPLHDRVAAAGSVFGQAYGWERPNWFASAGDDAAPALSFGKPGWFDAVARECACVAERAGLADMSPLAKFEVTGKDALSLVEQLGANRAPAQDGRIALTHALTPSGGIASEFTVMRLAADQFYLTSAAAARRQDHDLLSGLACRFDDARVNDITEACGVIAVMGPAAPAILDGLTSADLSSPAFPWLTAQTIRIAGVEGLAVRVSYVGEAGWELHADAGDLAALYDALLAAGRGHGIGHFGAYAANAMRLEKGYPAWGMDLSSERSPVEAGLQRFVKLDAHAFTGQEALADRPVAYRLCLLELAPSCRNAFGMHPVVADGKACGLVTSAAFGHRTGKSLAFAYVSAACPGDASLHVEVCGTPYPATILAAPPYDPRNQRMR